MSDYKDQIDLDKLKSFIPKKYTDISILSFGKRGIVLKAKIDDKFVAIKMVRPESNAINTIFLEAKNLRQVNKLNIGPNFIESTDNFVVMEFIDGVLIKEWIEKSTRDEILGMFSVLFHQLFQMDKAGINKFEMTNPHKHIIVTEEFMPVMIDFERARNTIKPKNITQFAQYLTSLNILPILQSKGILNNPEKFKEAIINYSKDKQEFDVVEKML